MFGRKKEDKKKLKEEKQLSKQNNKEDKNIKESKQAKTQTVKKETKKTVAKTSTTKPATKVSEKKAAVEKKAGIYRVVYDNKSKTWQIKLDGAKRIIDSKHTKEEALERVKELAESKDVGYVVHKKDGKFQKK